MTAQNAYSIFTAELCHCQLGNLDSELTIWFFNNPLALYRQGEQLSHANFRCDLTKMLKTKIA